MRHWKRFDVAKRKGEKPPDPLGKRALYWAPSAAAVDADPSGSSTVALPVGKRALYSGARADANSAGAASDNPLTERGVFTVRCQRCRQVSRIGLVDLLIFQFPIGMWIPRGRFDRRMTCPSCRKRSWCSVSLRR
jgi:hypothetical protein